MHLEKNSFDSVAFHALILMSHFDKQTDAHATLGQKHLAVKGDQEDPGVKWRATASIAATMSMCFDKKDERDTDRCSKAEMVCVLGGGGQSCREENWRPELNSMIRKLHDRTVR